MTISISKISGNGQSAKLNQLYANNLQVQVTDNATTPPTLITSGTVSFQNINNLVTQPAAPFNGAGSQTGECGPGGYASTSIKPRANGVAGKVTIRCWGFGAETNFTLTNKVPSGAPVASEIVVNTGDNQVVLQGGSASPSPTVKVTDQYDAVFAGASVTWTLPSSGASGTFTVGGGTSSTSTSDAGGIATCPAFTANSQLGPWVIGARLTADADVNCQFSLNTNPSSGTEVCINLIVPPTISSFPFAGNNYSWINHAQWTGAGQGVTAFPTSAAGHSEYVTAAGLAAALAAIPNAAEITRLTFAQNVRVSTIASTLRAFFEVTSFASPKVTSDSVFNLPATGTYVANTFTWTTFNTPNPGSKLLGSDVKSANFRLSQNSEIGGNAGGGQVDCRQLTISVCYIEPAAGGGAGAGLFCEI